jgi:hypothetical protein
MKLLTADEVADRLNKSRVTIDQWISKGQHCGTLFRKIGGAPMMLESDLNNWIMTSPRIGAPVDIEAKVDRAIKDINVHSRHGIAEVIAYMLKKYTDEYEYSDEDLWERMGSQLLNGDESDPKCFRDALNILDGYASNRLENGIKPEELHAKVYGDAYVNR